MQCACLRIAVERRTCAFSTTAAERTSILLIASGRILKQKKDELRQRRKERTIKNDTIYIGSLLKCIRSPENALSDAPTEG